LGNHDPVVVAMGQPENHSLEDNSEYAAARPCAELLGEIPTEHKLLTKAARRRETNHIISSNPVLGVILAMVVSATPPKREARIPTNGTTTTRNPTASPKSLKNMPSICQRPETNVLIERRRHLKASQIKRTGNHSTASTVK